MKYLFMICFALIACRAKRDNEPTAIITHDSRVEALLKKKELYCDLGRQYMVGHEFNAQGCDSLLFSSLWGMACGEIPIDHFMDEQSGQVFRTTDHLCYPGPRPGGDESKSSISKDMFRGLFLYTLQYHLSVFFKKVVSYAEGHNYFMGEAVDQQTRISRCLLSPDMITEMKDLQDKLDDPLNENFHIDEDSDVIGLNVGYQAHLDVLRIIFHGRLYGGITDSEKDILRGQAKRQPDNSLFVLAYKLYDNGYDGDTALSVLEDENYFPNGRLPVALDRSAPYLWERDESAKDWGPGTTPDEWPGVDFVFAVSLLE